ncbi:hypothetical protein ACTXT7_012388 [Hymenolepis weldensis]
MTHPCRSCLDELVESPFFCLFPSSLKSASTLIPHARPCPSNSFNFVFTLTCHLSARMLPFHLSLISLTLKSSSIASILNEQDEQDLGAFYLRDRKPIEQPMVRSARLSSSDVTPRTSSRRSSHVSFKLASPQIHHQLQKATPLNLSDYIDEVIILRKMIEELNHLVSIFDVDETDMDGYVISALLSSAGLETPLNVLNTEQLEVTIRLNRADIAKEKIFTEGRHWKRHGLDNFMFDAILNDQEAFVSLFVENGFDLESFLTVHTLEKLYTASMLKKDSKLDTIWQIWEACRIYKMEWVMLRDVGRIVKHLLGEFYHPYYLSKHFRKLIKKAVIQHEAEEKEIPITGNRSDSANGSNGRAVRRYVANYGRQLIANERSIWSQAPVVMEEDFGVEASHKHKESSRRLSLYGHVNIAYQCSRSEMSSLKEKGSIDTTDGSKSNRSNEKDEHKSNDTEDKKGDEGEQTDAGLSTTADPLSTTSMDDTFSTMRKSSFAGRHRGHHRLTVGKLSAAERSRLITAEARRREVAKAEEKERRRRHRLAQDKRTLYERICGINSQRLEQCIPEKLANFAAMQKVRLERPAKELMLLCILLGKLKLAVLFWGYEKEPIGGAMFCTLLLGKLAAVCTDISQKLEFERYARIFESKAEEVLEACYEEDNQRAKMLLYRKLQEYGHSAVIRLAARGGCIHFMSHPCCQDFLSEVWMGKLSSKTTSFQLIYGSIVGLVFPFILPQVMPYARNDKQINLLGIDNSDSNDSNEDEGGKENAAFPGNLHYSEDRRKKREPPPTLLKSPRRWFHRQIKDITQFYHAPVTRFLYNTIFYVAFLLVFSNMVLKNLKISFTIQEILTSIMVVSLLLEELNQAFGQGASLREYLSDGWNKLDCAAIGLYIGGFILRTLSYVIVRNVDLVEARRKLISENATCSYVDPSTLENASYPVSLASIRVAHLGLPEQIFAIPEWTLRCVKELDIDNPYFLLHEERFAIARIMFALSLFAFFVRLMYIFSFSIVLGPKLIMINRMAGYAQNTTLKYMKAGKIVYEFFMTAYFQMLGNFGLDILVGEEKYRSTELDRRVRVRRYVAKIDQTPLHSFQNENRLTKLSFVGIN